MSIHTCDTVEVKLEPHPNADSLSIIRVGGWQCLVKTTDWKDGDLGIYIPPDSIVKTNRPEFEFLKRDGSDTERIKAKKLRGIFSVGLLIPAPEGAKVGDDYMEYLEVEHYEALLPLTTGGDNVKPPAGVFPVYDVENFNRYPNVIQPGEHVIITEKIHGCSARFTWQKDQIYVGSRKSWKKQDEKNVWWKALAQSPWLEIWCKRYSELALYGEVFGRVQSLQYGASPNEFKFRVFDVWHKQELRFLNFDEVVALESFGLRYVPLLYNGPFDEEMARKLAEENTSITAAQHYREGVVIKPIIERRDGVVGRVILKIISNRYLWKS